MIWTARCCSCFVAVHVATMKYGAWYPATIHGEDGRDLYRLVTEVFRQPGWVAFYLVCMAGVGVHLWHGFSSAFESLGLNGPRFTPGAVLAGKVLASCSAPASSCCRSICSSPGPLMNGAPRIAPAGTRQLDAKIPSGRSREVGPLPVRVEAGEPGEPPPVHRHHRGHRARGGAAAATLGEAGYNVQSFCIQDSPRRAHSIAAQGGINAAKNYRNDGDSVTRLFYDTVKGGDYRAREATCIASPR